MNLPQMRSLVRRDLHDEDPADLRWTDAELDRHIGRALLELSRAIPDEQKLTRATVPGSRTLDISDLTGLAGLVSVEAVEYPIACFPPSLPHFTLWAGLLTFQGREIPDGSEAYVYYGRLHVLDDAHSTLPARYEDVLACGAAAYAAIEMGSYSTNRVNVGGLRTPTEFLAWGADMLVRFRRDLYILGKRNRVRCQQLF